MEWNQEVVDRVRMAMQERARNMGCVYQVLLKRMPREEAIGIMREAITRYGEIRAEHDPAGLTPDDWTNTHYKMMGGVFETKIDINDEFAEMQMNYCPLLVEWKSMGFSQDDQDVLCDIAMELDRNRATQHNINCDIVERQGKGDTFCRVVLWKKDKPA